MFLSEAPSGGVKFLGLQLGRAFRDDESDNKDMNYQFQLVLEALTEEYGIRHNDVEGNAVIIEANGCEKIVAIDFEDWQDLFEVVS